MAGGVMTCQVTHTPVCSKDTMAVIVRQSIYDWNTWVPITIPSYGTGNDDFIALADLVQSDVQDDFAKAHNVSCMRDMLEEAFIINMTLPKTLKEEKLCRRPVGIIYINNELWPEIRKEVPKYINTYQKFDTDVDSWVTSFIDTVQEETKHRQHIIFAIGDEDMKTRYKDMESWYFYREWNKPASNYMETWSEHCNMFSLEAYFPIAKQRAINNDVKWLTEFFNGLLELIYIHNALGEMRHNWFPQVTWQEYDISEFHDFIARTIRKDFRAEKEKNKYRGW